MTGIASKAVFNRDVTDVAHSGSASMVDSVMGHGEAPDDAAT